MPLNNNAADLSFARGLQNNHSICSGAEARVRKSAPLPVLGLRLRRAPYGLGQCLSGALRQRSRDPIGIRVFDAEGIGHLGLGKFARLLEQRLLEP